MSGNVSSFESIKMIQSFGQTYSTSWDGVDINPNLLIDPEDVGTLIVAITNLSARSVVEELILMPQKLYSFIFFAM